MAKLSSRRSISPDAMLILAVSTANEGHWAGTIATPVTYVVDGDGKVRWAYVSDSASDRPSPVARRGRWRPARSHQRPIPVNLSRNFSPPVHFF